MKRKIIRIDETKCDGCGVCISACSEGALQIVDGKAKLVKEQFCDGFGDCLGECPQGALRIEECEAAEFDFGATLQHVRTQGGKEAEERMLAAAKRHDGGAGALNNVLQEKPCCPGSMARTLKARQAVPATPAASGSGRVIPSELSHWPVQIHLVRPDAPFFKNRELVVMSTCGPIASADVHWRFIRGRSVVVGCPKLDRTEGYAEKLARILMEASIPKVIVVRMEVPCCGGLTAIVQEAVRLSGREDLAVEEVVLSVEGEVLQ